MESDRAASNCGGCHSTGDAAMSSAAGPSLHHEIRRLEAEKELIEARISLLRSQLERGGAATAVPGYSVGVECCDEAAVEGWRPLTAPHRGEERTTENGTATPAAHVCGLPSASLCGLSPDMIYRYSRHLLLPSFGVDGQVNLSKASILVVGAGGLGSPVTMYLAACGVGCLGIVDNDNVELNNLHRQIVHTEAYIGEPKVKSAAAACHAINSTVTVVEHREALLVTNALDIISKYDVVVDATDNLPSRYMISDCCVLLDKPVVSGAALGLEGQVHVIGAFFRHHLLQKHARDVLTVEFLVWVKLRGRSLHCDMCGENPVFTPQIFRSFNYENFTQSPFFDLSKRALHILPMTARISSREYKQRVDSCEPHVLVDVRPAHHFKIAALSNSISIPLSSLEEKLSTIDSAMKIKQGTSSHASLYVICRRGNDSQRAVKFLHENGFFMAKDIIGGLESWSQEVDHKFPVY